MIDRPAEDRLRRPQLPRPRGGAGRRPARAAAALREVAEHADRRRASRSASRRSARTPTTRPSSASSSGGARAASRSTTRSTSCAATSSRTTSPGRDLQFSDGQWVRGKSLDTFLPVGELVPASEVPDPQALPIRAILNGETMQDSNTSNQIFGVAEVDLVRLAGDHARARRPDHHGHAGRRRRVPQAAGLAAARRRDHDRDRRHRLDHEPRRRRWRLIEADAASRRALPRGARRCGRSSSASGRSSRRSRTTSTSRTRSPACSGRSPCSAWGSSRRRRRSSPRRIGSRRAIGAALALIGLFGVARAVVPGAAGVVLLTFPVGIGMGLGGALLPVAREGALRRPPGVRDRRLRGGHQRRRSRSSAAAVPLAHALGRLARRRCSCSAPSRSALARALARADARRAGARPRRIVRPLALPLANLARAGGSSRRSSSCRSSTTG